MSEKIRVVDDEEYRVIDLDKEIEESPRYELPRALYPDLDVETPGHYDSMLDFLEEHFDVDVSQAGSPESQRVLQILHANMTNQHRFEFFNDTEKAAVIGDANKSQPAVARLRKLLRVIAPDGMDTVIDESVDDEAD